jgi:hypothetical protein
MRLRTPPHPLACQYGNQLFFFVPGNPGNPFVALWQAALLEAVILAVAALMVLHLARRQDRTRLRVVGYGYFAASGWTGALALITFTSTTPLACGGAPGSPLLSRAHTDAYHTFTSLQFLGTMTLYLTVLLLAALALPVAFQTSARWRSGTR